ncbi:S-layer homology domain-containing protein [Dysosmobacter sp.]|uniref:S-layer homology domain-containing protein n=1 Tax=Dysosmobacter sp. TaxID=2591382 RepID=UPI0028439926|nr:S-layer homology domain-containing protein [Dysosmobacter sp.]MDR3985191.1 S-layer homology domain-containing protein [Dysosmobacter sp.]
MKKRIAALILACVLMTVPVLAAENTADNFTRTRTYAGEFSDLTSDSPFYENVTALYEYGLTVGKGDGTFGLTDTMTVGQIVIFAGRIHSLYRTGDPEAGAAAQGGDGTTAEPYLHYLQAEGALGTELDGLLTTTATRAQVAHVLANTLPEEALPPVHADLVTQAYASRQFITDVTEYTPYYQDILTLYRTGVSVGSDAAGSFLPDQPITRGAAAAMLTRMVDPSLRATPDWDLGKESWSALGAAMGDLVPLGTYIAAPATAAEIDESVRYMLASNQNTLVLQYPSLSVTSARRVMEAALAAVKTYCEQCYNTVNCTYSADGSITLTFSAASAGDQILTYRDAAMEAAIAVHDALWESGEITTSMSDYEKAQVYFTWICDNCVYDYTAGDSSLSHIAYSLFENGTAVCDGYTGAYNLLLKLEGIDCTALSNNSHIWTVATLDGTDYHIDTTWGDSGPAPNYDYFAMTAEESWQHHSW